MGLRTIAFVVDTAVREQGFMCQAGQDAPLWSASLFR